MLKYRVFVLLLLLTNLVYAECETQRKEYEEWDNKCTTLRNAAATGIGLAASFAPFTGGLSLFAIPTVCAGCGEAAQNACRIRDEKFINLTNCIKEYQERIEKQELEAKRKKALLESLPDQIENAKRSKQRTFEMYCKYFDNQERKELLNYTNEQREQGYMPTEEEQREVIETIHAKYINEKNLTKAELDEILNEEIQELKKQCGL